MCRSSDALHPAARHAYVATGLRRLGHERRRAAPGACWPRGSRARRRRGPDLYDPGRLNPLRETPAMLRLQAEVCAPLRRRPALRPTARTRSATSRRAAARSSASAARQRAVHRDERGRAAHPVRALHPSGLSGAASTTPSGPGSARATGPASPSTASVLQGPAVHPLERRTCPTPMLPNPGLPNPEAARPRRPVVPTGPGAPGGGQR